MNTIDMNKQGDIARLRDMKRNLDREFGVLTDPARFSSPEIHDDIQFLLSMIMTAKRTINDILRKLTEQTNE